MSDSARSGVNRRPSLISFTVKTIVVATVVTISFIILIDHVMSSLNDMIDWRVGELRQALAGSEKKFTGRAFWAHIATALDQAADPKHDISPEQQEKLLEDIHVLAERARPFIAAAETAFPPSVEGEGPADKK